MTPMTRLPCVVCKRPGIERKNGAILCDICRNALAASEADRIHMKTALEFAHQLFEDSLKGTARIISRHSSYPIIYTALSAPGRFQSSGSSHLQFSLTLTTYCGIL